jgi:hypothetical protein
MARWHQVERNRKDLFLLKQQLAARYGIPDLTNATGDTLKRMAKMMFMSLTLMAGTIAVMFVATAVSSIVNSVRENETARQAATRHAVF